MKNTLIILIVILLSISTLFCRNGEPVQRKFYLESDSIYLNGNIDYFKQKEFMLGWQWGGRARITRAELVRQKDVSYPDPKYPYIDDCLNDCVDSAKLFVRLQNVVTNSHGMDGTIFNAQGIQYEPTLHITSQGTFQVNPSDSSKSVFGFHNMNTNVIKSGTYLKVPKTIQTGDTILSKPWPDNVLFLNTSPLQDYLESHLGGKYYLSINLKRTLSIPANQTLSNSNRPILKIKLPYKFNYTHIADCWTYYDGPGASNIVFSEIPQRKNYLTRGMEYWNLQDSIVDDFVITEGMIPYNSDSSVIISAGFLLTGERFPLPTAFPETKAMNLQLHTSERDTMGNQKINFLGIDVIYLGDTSSPEIAIDWLRFETPHTNEFLKGKYDNLIVAEVQDALNYFTQNEFKSRGIKPYRFLTCTETGVKHWMVDRYINKLIGNVTSTETGICYPKLYEYYVNPPDRWASQIKYYDADQTCCVSAPYSANFGVDKIYSLGVLNGFMGCGVVDFNHPSFDKTYSNYETYLLYDTTLFPIDTFLTRAKENNFDLEFYINTILPSHKKTSTLEFWEVIVFGNFYDKANTGLLYSNVKWWSQTFNHIMLKDYFTSNLGKDTSGNYLYHNPNITNEDNIYTIFNTRPFTGEEQRLSMYLPVIMGAKGLIYDGPECTDDTKICMYNGGLSSTRTQLEGITDDLTFLKDGRGGGDFIDNNYEYLKLCNRMALDSAAKYHERRKNKLYIGRTSVRLEMFKTHTWVRAVEDELMNLKLMATYNKGFMLWKSHAPDISADSIYKFFNPDGIRTKAPYNDTCEGKSTYNYQDSSFFDVTLLKNMKLDSSARNVFYIGLVNRRTSPLVRELDDSLYFYSTAEFDEYMQKGGRRLSDNTTQDTTYWRNQYKKQMGRRDIIIPMSVGGTRYKFEGKFYHVTELGYDMLDTLYWRKPYVASIINDTISEDSYLTVSLAPGEGKILKFERIWAKKPGDTATHYCNWCKNGVNPFSITIKNSKEDCCADVWLHYTGDCELEDFPISLQSPPDDLLSNSEIDGDYFSEKTGNYNIYSWLINSANLVGDSLHLGKFCLEQRKFYEFTLVVTAQKNDTTDCNFRTYAGMYCPHDTIPPPADCCDRIVVRFVCDKKPNCSGDYKVEILGINEECGIYGVSVNVCYNRNTKSNIDSLCVPFNHEQAFVSGSYTGRISNPFEIETPTPPYEIHPPYGSKCFEFVFFDKDGDTLCTKTICNEYLSNPIDRDEIYRRCALIAIKQNETAENNYTLSLSCRPNPTDGQTEVVYSIAEESNVKIELFDNLGTRKAELFNGNSNAGQHIINTNLNKYPSGVYYLKITTGVEQRTIQVQMIK